MKQDGQTVKIGFCARGMCIVTGESFPNMAESRTARALIIEMARGDIDLQLELIMLLAEYGVITNENVKLLYQSEYYYKNRLASLARGEMIERLYGKAILGRKGKQYLNKTVPIF